MGHWSSTTSGTQEGICATRRNSSFMNGCSKVALSGNCPPPERGGPMSVSPQTLRLARSFALAAIATGLVLGGLEVQHRWLLANSAAETTEALGLEVEVSCQTAVSPHSPLEEW